MLDLVLSTRTGVEDMNSTRRCLNAVCRQIGGSSFNFWLAFCAESEVGIDRGRLVLVAFNRGSNF